MDEGSKAQDSGNGSSLRLRSELLNDGMTYLKDCWRRIGFMFERIEWDSVSDRCDC